MIFAIIFRISLIINDFLGISKEVALGCTN